jgi:hypothetical protein
MALRRRERALTGGGANPADLDQAIHAIRFAVVELDLSAARYNRISLSLSSHHYGNLPHPLATISRLPRGVSRLAAARAFGDRACGA